MAVSSTAQHTSRKEIVSRSSTSLQTLFLTTMDTSTNKRNSLVYKVFPSALIPLSANPLPKSPSTLKLLIIHNMHMTYDDLVSILQASPSLTELRLFGTDFIGRRSAGLSQHTGVAHFSLWTSNTVESNHGSTAHSTPSSSSSSSSSIFAYFPPLDAFTSPAFDPIQRSPSRKSRTKSHNTAPIHKSIDLWRAGCERLRQEVEDEEMEEVEKETKRPRTPDAAMRLDGMDFPIEARIARHLLKLEKLENVWLGHKTWTLT